MKRWAHPVHGWHCSSDDAAMIAAGWALDVPEPVAKPEPESAGVPEVQEVKRKPGRPRKE